MPHSTLQSSFAESVLEGSSTPSTLSRLVRRGSSSSHRSTFSAKDCLSGDILWSAPKNLTEGKAKGAEGSTTMCKETEGPNTILLYKCCGPGMSGSNTQHSLSNSLKADQDREYMETAFSQQEYICSKEVVVGGSQQSGRLCVTCRGLVVG